MGKSGSERQLKYEQRMREKGYVRLCIWVPKDEALKQKVRDFVERVIKLREKADG